MTAAKDLIAHVEQAQQQIRTLRKEVAERVKAQLATVFFEIFANNPKLKWVRWTQYTPYFNDGDTCVFRVHQDLDCNFDGKEFEWMSPWLFSERNTHSDKSQYPEGLEQALTPFFELLAGVDDQVFLDIFGDHMHVTITADGIDTEYYEHD